MPPTDLLTFCVHVHGADDIPVVGSLFGNSNAYISIKADGEKLAKTEALQPSDTGSVSWEFRTEIQCPHDTKQLEFELKRVGFFGQHIYVGGCSLALATLSDIDDGNLPIWDPSSTVVGQLRASIRREGGAGTVTVPRGLANHATGSCLASGQRAPSLHQWAAVSTGPVAGGLVNRAATAASGGLVSHVPSGGSGDAPAESARGARAGSAELTNRAEAAGPSRPFPERQGTLGLANRAELAEDGTRPNALPRSREILAGLSTFRPDSREDLQTLAQAVEQLRHAPAVDLRSHAGQGVLKDCSLHIQALFESALARNDDKDMGAALSLAGRLPSPDDDGDVQHVTLQDRLRTKWNSWKMAEAFQLAQAQVGDAANGGEALEGLMDQLDFAEFHARLAGKDPQPQTGRILAALRPQISTRLRGLLQKGQWDEVESAIGIIGAARIHVLQLHGVQLELQRSRGLYLLRDALMPIPGQIGFPELKRRQLRHAMMTVRTALMEDQQHQMAAALRQVLLGELLPACLAHSHESAEWAIRTSFDLRLSEHDVWGAVQPTFEGLPGSQKGDLARTLPPLCSELGKNPPGWLLSPEQIACQQAIQAALAGGDCSRIRATCQRILETEGAQDVCQEDMRAAVSRLRQEYQLPAGWDVEAMIGASHKKLLVRNEVADPALLGLFDQLLKATAEPSVRTRDRRGGLPQTFNAVRAVQVMNGEIWKDYLRRRDEVAAECRRAKARHDLAHWRDNLNGPVASMDVISGRLSAMSDTPPTLPEANEVWLLHGTSHAAAEGITSEDFDMTRASPSGLFGAGVYFAESSSKADEYAEGSGSPELYPMLLCRVCLGHVFYCDERRPDRRELERKCLRDQWNCVLGDRKKTSGTFREFVIYDSLQAFPAYIIYYKRQY